jgi:hypothetical protein
MRPRRKPIRRRGDAGQWSCFATAGVSQRRACEIVAQHCSIQRHQPVTQIGSCRAGRAASRSSARESQMIEDFGTALYMGLFDTERGGTATDRRVSKRRGAGRRVVGATLRRDVDGDCGWLGWPCRVTTRLSARLRLSGQPAVAQLPSSARTRSQSSSMEAAGRLVSCPLSRRTITLPLIPSASLHARTTTTVSDTALAIGPECERAGLPRRQRCVVTGGGVPALGDVRLTRARWHRAEACSDARARRRGG